MHAMLHLCDSRIVLSAPCLDNEPSLSYYQGELISSRTRKVPFLRCVRAHRGQCLFDRYFSRALKNDRSLRDMQRTCRTAKRLHLIVASKRPLLGEDRMSCPRSFIVCTLAISESAHAVCQDRYPFAFHRLFVSLCNL